MPTNSPPHRHLTGTLPHTKGVTAHRVIATGERAWMTVEEAAEALDVTPRTVRNWCHSGQLVWQRRGLHLMRVSAGSVRAIRETDSAQELDRVIAAKLRG